MKIRKKLKKKPLLICCSDDVIYSTVAKCMSWYFVINLLNPCRCDTKHYMNAAIA